MGVVAAFREAGSAVSAEASEARLRRRGSGSASSFLQLKACVAGCEVEEDWKREECSRNKGAGGVL